MVRLYPAPPGGGPRGPLMMPRQRRPHEFIEPGFIPRYGMTRGYNFMRGPHMRPGLPRSRPPPPHLVPPPLPPRRLPLPPHQRLGLPPREIPGPHPLHLPGRRPGMPPPMPPMHPGLPHRGALRPGPPLGLIRGRGGLARRGVAVKRLGSANLHVRPKRIQKRKERTEEMEANKPWVTEVLKTEIHKKYQLFESAKEKKTESDWQAYKDQRILVGKMMNIAKLEYIGSHPEADVDKIMFGGAPKG